MHKNEKKFNFSFSSLAKSKPTQSFASKCQKSHFCTFWKSAKPGKKFYDFTWKLNCQRAESLFHLLLVPQCRKWLKKVFSLIRVSRFFQRIICSLKYRNAIVPFLLLKEDRVPILFLSKKRSVSLLFSFPEQIYVFCSFCSTH